MTPEHFNARRDDDLAPSPFEAARLKSPAMRDIWTVAQSNIDSAYRVSRLPFEIALTSEWTRQRESVRATQFIVGKTRVIEKKIRDDELDDFVRTETSRAFESMTPGEGEPYVGFNNARDALDLAVRVFKLEDSAARLRLQIIVLAWSAIEVSARDTFAALLNAHPHLVRALRSDERAAKRFQLRHLDLDLFLDQGFDLTGRLGDVLLRQADVDSVRSFREVFGALMPGEEGLLRAFAGGELRQLAERRHLIVHHAGRITDAFVANTDSKQRPGERLLIEVHEVDAALRLAQSTAVELVLAADRCLTAAA